MAGSMFIADLRPTSHEQRGVSSFTWKLPRQAQAAASAAVALHGGGEPAFVARLAVDLIEGQLRDASAALFEITDDGVVGVYACGKGWRADEDAAASRLPAHTAALAGLVRSPSVLWGRLVGAERPDDLGDPSDFGQVPVVVGGVPRAALVVLWRTSSGEREGDQWFLQQVATQLGLALDRAYAEERLAGALNAARAGTLAELRLARLEGLARLASAVSHDLSNTLTTISGLVEWTIESLAPDAEARADLELVAKAADEATGLVTRLRTFAAIGRRTERDVCRLEDLVTCAVETIQPRIKVAVAHGQPLQIVEQHAAAAAAKGNAHDLVDLLTELLHNAIDASPKDGLVRIESGVRGNEVFISIGDSGEGIPGEIRDRLGEPFVSTRGRRSKGLGLSLCWRVARLHGGRLTVDSTPGQGTTATLWLPDAGAGLGDAPKSRGSVLLVDDDEHVRVTVSGMLAALGWDVTTAVGAVDALHSVEEGRFDAVLIDLVMPGRSGLDLARDLRQRAVTTPIALFTGAMTTFDEQALDDIQAVVAKPLTLSRLSETLEVLTSGPVPETLLAS